jgi:uncharacterized glyoxalase superfamily protein PhnB
MAIENTPLSEPFRDPYRCLNPPPLLGKLGTTMIALADCAVAVSDAKNAAQWWSESLGFETHRVGDGDHAVMVAPPGDRFVLHLCQGFESVAPGNTGIAFVTDDIDKLVERMVAAGVEFPEPLRKESWGGMAKFADPDGNVFWLLGASTRFIRREVTRKAPGSTPAGRNRRKVRSGGRKRARR